MTLNISLSKTSLSMIKTILINTGSNILHGIKHNIHKHCPQINICGSATSYSEALELISEYNPSLAFIDADVESGNAFQDLQNTSFSNLETIFFSSSKSLAAEAFKYKASGFILKPIDAPELIMTVKNVEDRIEQKKKNHQAALENASPLQKLPPGNLIGIPTFEGFDFIPVENIIRCEGMQKCTRIIIRDSKSLISSYNIGAFIKLLEPYQFFSTHKSHLINLIHIKKYYKEGSIKMTDDSSVPVSKRRKSLFLNRMLLSK